MLFARFVLWFFFGRLLLGLFLRRSRLVALFGLGHVLAVKPVYVEVYGAESQIQRSGKAVRQKLAQLAYCGSDVFRRGLYRYYCNKSALLVGAYAHVAHLYALYLTGAALHNVFDHFYAGVSGAARVAEQQNFFEVFPFGKVYVQKICGQTCIHGSKHAHQNNNHVTVFRCYNARDVQQGGKHKYQRYAYQRNQRNFFRNFFHVSSVQYIICRKGRINTFRCGLNGHLPRTFTFLLY